MFTGRVVLEALPAARRPGQRQFYRLLEPLAFHSARFRRTFTAAAGAITDFASIPAVAQLWLDDDDPVILRPSIIHDVLYAEARLSRRQADGVLREAMEHCGATWWQRWSAWVAVRGFGGAAYGRRDSPTRGGGNA